MKPIIITGDMPGPTLAIIGGTHGNETCGLALLGRLREDLTLTQWKVILLYGNIRAIAAWVRQTDMNLNRAFLEDDTLSNAQKNTYEYARSREMMEVLRGCDYSLDVHSSPTVGSPPFVICEENAFSLARCLPLPIRCSGFDAVEPGSTEYFMNRIGRTGIGIECGSHSDPKAFECALGSARALLAGLGMINSPTPAVYLQCAYRADSKYLTRTTRFRISKPFTDFESIVKGQLLATDDSVLVYAEHDGYILFARDRDEVGVEGFVTIVRSS